MAAAALLRNQADSGAPIRFRGRSAPRGLSAPRGATRWEVITPVSVCIGHCPLYALLAIQTLFCRAECGGPIAVGRQGRKIRSRYFGREQA